MIDQQYYDEQSDRYFSDLWALAEHYDDSSDDYELLGLPDVIYACRLETIRMSNAQRVINRLIEDFRIEREGNERRMFYRNWTTAELLARSFTESFYDICPIDEIPEVKGVEELQRSLDFFTAINKVFWMLGGDSAIGLCIVDRALRKIERENADTHCLWYPTRERIELNDRVWQSLEMENWQLIDREWRAIA